MPFTLAHPAIVIPLKNRFKNYFNLVALVLGSMAPDFEYFINLKIKGEIGHSLLGFIVYNLPLVIVFSIVFNIIIRPTLSLHLPTFVSKYIRIDYNNLWEEFKQSWVRKILIFVISALIGMSSHVFWDSFTHETGFFVIMFPVLKNIMIGVPVFKILQHGSTFIGTLYILKTIYCNKAEVGCNQIISKNRKIVYWVSIMILTSLFLIFRLLIIDSRVIGTFIVTCISGFFVATTISSIVFYRKVE